MKTRFRSLPWAIVACLMFGCLTFGCGGPATHSDPNSSTLRAEGAPAASGVGASHFTPRRPSQAYADPGDAVRDFLTAVQGGDEKTATSLLTSAAQEEAWENGLAISADGFPDAKFDVSEVEYLTGNSESHVMSVWTDKTSAGETKNFQCVWLLRQEQQSWCIYGMATKFLESMAPVVLNFEDQSDMMKKQKWAADQIAKHRQLQQKEVQGPVQQVARPSSTTTR